VVNISDGALFESVSSYDGIRVRYGNGPILPTVVRSLPTTADDKVALRFITPDWEHHIWLYVLGTAAEAEGIRRSVWHPDDNHFDKAAFQRIAEER
jgi:hypothetical protein